MFRAVRSPTLHIGGQPDVTFGGGGFVAVSFVVAAIGVENRFASGTACRFPNFGTGWPRYVGFGFHSHMIIGVGTGTNRSSKKNPHLNSDLSGGGWCFHARTYPRTASSSQGQAMTIWVADVDNLFSGAIIALLLPLERFCLMFLREQGSPYSR